MAFRLILSIACLCALSAQPGITRAEGQQNLGSAGDGKEPEIKVSEVPQPGRSVKAGRAEGIVDAPYDAVRSVVEDYANYDKFMPHFRASRVLSRRGASALVYMQASLAKDTVTLWAQLKIGERPSIGKTRILEGKMVQGNMDAMLARWEMTPVDGQHTLVAFQLLMDPKLPLPAGYVSGENVKASQKTIRALRKVVAERIAANSAAH
jgi:ribosome-associated toxin RatA of RatAB toxin-antitoxin module